MPTRAGLEANRMHEIKERMEEGKPGVRTISGGGLKLVSEGEGMCCKGGIQADRVPYQIAYRSNL